MMLRERLDRVLREAISADPDAELGVRLCIVRPALSLEVVTGGVATPVLPTTPNK